jgi:hypothetical protein
MFIVERFFWILPTAFCRFWCSCLLCIYLHLNLALPVPFPLPLSPAILSLPLEVKPPLVCALVKLVTGSASLAATTNVLSYRKGS